MPKQYRIQRATLQGKYKTCYETNARPAAWRAFKETSMPPGHKKRLQEWRDGKYRTIKQDRVNVI
jgi:hypothetical protein